jgi:hypothetical protein
MPNPKQIFLEVIKTKLIDAKWAGQPHETFKNLPNSSKGDAGEEFIRRYAKELGFTVEKLKRLGDWDLKIQGKKFEVKLATEDTSGNLQFNHIRYDSKYDYLLCLGVTPNHLFFGIWNKGEVATGVAGNLVSMGKNQNSSFKLTKKASNLYDIEKLQKILSDILPK